MDTVLSRLPRSLPNHVGFLLVYDDLTGRALS